MPKKRSLRRKKSTPSQPRQRGAIFLIVISLIIFSFGVYQAFRKEATIRTSNLRSSHSPWHANRSLASTSHFQEKADFHSHSEDDPYEGRPIVAQKETPADPEGTFSRIKIIQTTAKHPLVRVHEKITRNNPNHENRVTSRISMVADHIIVRLNSAFTESDLAELAASLGFGIRNSIPHSNHYLIKVDGQDPDAIEKAIERLKKSNMIEEAGPDYIFQAN